MKKIVFMDKSERDAFINYCKTIENVEKDKDRFLKASRLERHESKREPLKAADIIKMVIILAVSLVCCVILILGSLSGSLKVALIGIGSFAIIAGVGALIAAGLSD